MDTASKIIENIIDRFSNVKHQDFRLQDMLFAFDSDLTYGQMDTIPRGKLFKSIDFQYALSPHLDRGPSWVHANLLRLHNEMFLVTICFGVMNGNKTPDLNISVELNRLVEIVN